MLLPRLGVGGQEDARCATGKEDGHRVVVGLREELPWRWCDHVSPHAAREERSTLCLICESPWPPARSAHLGDHLFLTERETLA